MEGVATAHERPAGGEEEGAGGVPRRAWLAAILLVALVLRLLWSLYAGRVPQGLHDPAIYLAQGRAISEGLGYLRIDGAPTAYFPVGYPAFVAGMTWVVNHTPLNDVPKTIAVVQALLGTFSVWLVWRCACAVATARTALTAAAIVAVFPGLLLYSAPLLSETLFLTLELAALAVLLTGSWDGGAPTWRRLVAFGALVGLAALVRPQVVLFVPALVLALALTRLGWRRSLIAGAVAAGAAVLVISPWTVRNAVTMNAFVPISTNAGDDLCIGHNEDATGRFGFFDPCEDTTGKRPGPEPEIALDERNTRVAVEFALQNPGRELELLPRKLYYLYEGDRGATFAAESFGKDPFLSVAARSRLNRLSDVYFFVVLALALAGMALLARGRDARRTMLLIATLAMALIPVAFFGDMRFHVPASPLFAIAAAIALERIVWRRRGRGRQAAV